MSEELIVPEVKDIVYVPEQSQPDRLLEMAIANGADMNKLEKLLDLKERFDNEQARKAFTAALASFKSEDLHIIKDRTVTIETQDKGTYGYTHASLGNIIGTAVPIMSKHGLSHRWESVQADARVKVTCILTHKDGHSESTTMEASPDTSGKKNGIQQVASTLTYLQRYTFLSITGLAVEEMDNDGQSFPEKKQTNKQQPISPEPVSQKKVDAAYKAFKEVIDADVDIMDHQRLQAGYNRLTNDEQMAVFNKFGKEKAEGSDRGYRAIIKELLAITGDK